MSALAACPPECLAGRMSETWPEDERLVGDPVPLDDSDESTGSGVSAVWDASPEDVAEQALEVPVDDDDHR